jgi:hypothetical protein
LYARLFGKKYTLERSGKGRFFFKNPKGPALQTSRAFRNLLGQKAYGRVLETVKRGARN